MNDSRLHYPLPSLRSSLAILGTLAALQAFATDGYYSDGYGIKAKGRGGVALTEVDDAFGGANNPATVSYEIDRVDVGVDWFRPTRSASRSGAGPLDGSVESAKADFFIPEVGFRKSINEAWSFGLAIYGNGGMNTDYPGGQLNLGPGPTRNLLAGVGHLGVSFSQLFVAPTAAWRPAENHSLGVTPILAYQTFRAYGIDAFKGLSQDPSAVSNVGPDSAVGGGVRLGYLWNVTHDWSLGAVYSSRIYTTGFDKYRGLFAGNGSFDAPQSVGGGIGWQALSSLRLGADYKWIDYASIAPVGNPSSNPGLLGVESGPGFGWHSVSVFKVGADWQATDGLTLRTGYAFSQNPVRPSDVTFNILAPGIVQHHLTFGATYAWHRHELTIAYLHAFESRVTGASAFIGLGYAPPGTTETISMEQNSFALEYSFKF